MADEPEKPRLIGRRNVLKYGGLLTATAAGQEFLSEWMGGGNAEFAAPAAQPGRTSAGRAGQEPPATNAHAPYAPRFFRPEEFRAVEILTEIIIPTDDKPGAKEAHVAQYIDFVVHAAAEFKQELQEQWMKGLEELGQLSRQKFGRSFLELTAAEREKLLAEISRPEYDDVPVSAPKYKSMRLQAGMSRPERSAATAPPGFAFYKLTKEMTVEAFYSSKVGLKDVLDYKGLSINSDFPGCTHPEHQA